jgi:hypothetical protein
LPWWQSRFTAEDGVPRLTPKLHEALDGEDVFGSKPQPSISVWRCYMPPQPYVSAGAAGREWSSLDVLRSRWMSTGSHCFPPGPTGSRRIPLLAEVERLSADPRLVLKICLREGDVRPRGIPTAGSQQRDTNSGIPTAGYQQRDTNSRIPTAGSQQRDTNRGIPTAGSQQRDPNSRMPTTGYQQQDTSRTPSHVTAAPRLT